MATKYIPSPRLKAIDSKTANRIVSQHKAGLNLKELMSYFGLSKGSIQRILREHREASSCGTSS